MKRTGRPPRPKLSDAQFLHDCDELSKKIWPVKIAQALGISAAYFRAIRQAKEIPVYILERSKTAFPKLFALPRDDRVITFIRGNQRRIFEAEKRRNQERVDRIRHVFSETSKLD